MSQDQTSPSSSVSLIPKQQISDVPISIGYGTIKSSRKSLTSQERLDAYQDNEIPRSALPGSSVDSPSTLHRGLHPRQVQMIAIAGTIGTGLFLGTGRSLAQGGPASMLICYSIVGFIVYVTLLLLGEMATQYPVAGSFNAYATRFFSPAYGFSLSWNYWFNDAVSVASDLTAAQLVLEFWSVPNSWLFCLAVWIFLVSVNSIHVKAYGELEYWLSSLKVMTIVLFILVGILVNVGANREHRFIGFENWSIPGAPFVGGFGGFAHVFVTASFAYGGTESLGITAGETRNPGKNMPIVVKFVFWRILLFYLLTILLIGLNVPWDYPNLSNKSATTSPFTIVFKKFGSTTAASLMNTVILSSVISAGNHALFAGTRVLYGLAEASQAPSLFARTTRGGVPLPALLMTSSISALCFASSFIGSGQLWAWLQNLVGVSNQIAWLSIGIASWRFRAAWRTQGRPLSEMKFRVRWTWPWGPPFVITAVSAIILIQGWSSVIPHFSAVDFVLLYIELFVMALMYILWLLVRRGLPLSALSISSPAGTHQARPFFDFVDLARVDLYHDEHEDEQTDKHEDEVRAQRLSGRAGWAWALFYAVV
ncbi:amino acid permease-domain-containing protein [Multifurca ochricompacta]|uniref:Amino acid permease-domain-containing protein n=1 Tax=Multifurca ochricompacta TaxID=376703 RepID=A0AAD4M7N6_9AGAM|nr:amino acid permease-domain-containing protein [Multifurca ochricompacta]